MLQIIIARYSEIAVKVAKLMKELGLNNNSTMITVTELRKISIFLLP
jgi:hypothetical protein